MKLSDRDWIYECVGVGWAPLLRDLCDELEKVAPDLEVVQVKEKFGGLRFYTSPYDPIVEDIVTKAENKSFGICEWCGERGSSDYRYYWTLTLCEECKDVRKKQRGG